MLDFIFLIGLAIAVYVGYRSGFAKALVGFVSIFLSAIGGYLLYPYVSSFLMKTPLYGVVHSWVTSGVQGYVSQNANQGDLLQRYQVTAVEFLTPQIASSITAVIFNIISILLIIFVVKLVVLVLKKCTDFINHIPFVGKINRWVGCVFSGASYIVTCFLIVAVMFLPPANTSELSRDMRQKIDRSIIVKPVMKCNFFVDYQNVN